MLLELMLSGFCLSSSSHYKTKNLEVEIVARSVQRYRSIAEPHELLRIRIRELALLRHRYGYRRLHVLLRREGFEVGQALVYRLYSEEGLVLRPRRPRRHVSAAHRQGLCTLGNHAHAGVGISGRGRHQP